MPTNKLEMDAWPTCPEEFTRVMDPLPPHTLQAHKNGPNTTATSPRVQTDTLQTPDKSTSDSVLSTPYTLHDHVLAYASKPKTASTKRNKCHGPPVGGYKDNKLDYNLKLKVRGRIEMLDCRGPNSDLGGGQSYEKDFVDLNGDITMQSIIWTTKTQTLFLRRRFDTVLISSTMDGIPSLVITTPKETTMPERVNGSSNAPRSKRNNEYDQDIPVYANGVWAPVDIKKRKENTHNTIVW